jgi:putative radical SAM enzyme (TIGR03279 family)
MKIKSVAENSIASAHGISAGDELVEISGHPVNDIIDYRFLAADQALELRLRSRHGKVRNIRIRKPPDEDLGLEFHAIRYKSCKNACMFCFVHQLPKGLRKALYFKDEDFRLSFLHGNFITLTNTSDADIERIISQRLSPLYVSVHATDEKLRKEILANPRIPDIMPQIQKLAGGRIEMHAQIVLCPGINDGEYLEKSVRDLSVFYPHVKSLALVPVGLTRFREKLPRIRPVGKAHSTRIVQMVDRWQRAFRRKWRCGFVYAADEFFTKAGIDVPAARYYDEFPQIENGVGMMRQFLDDFRANRKLLPKSLKGDLTITLVTGVSAFRLIKQIVSERLSSISGLKVQIIVVKNEFFGTSVTVTGLLTGGDILCALRSNKRLGDIVLLPPNCFNENGVFLDDLTPQDLERELGRRVIVGSYDLAEDLTSILAGSRCSKQSSAGA